jgi:hypothetical protein
VSECEINYLVAKFLQSKVEPTGAFKIKGMRLYWLYYAYALRLWNCGNRRLPLRKLQRTHKKVTAAKALNEYTLCRYPFKDSIWVMCNGFLMPFGMMGLSINAKTSLMSALSPRARKALIDKVHFDIRSLKHSFRAKFTIWNLFLPWYLIPRWWRRGMQ